MDTIIEISDSFYEVFDYIGYYFHIFAPFAYILIGVAFLITVIRALCCK